MIIDFVGKFYDNHSLSIINRNLVIQLTTIYPDWKISITPLDSYDPEYKIDKDIVKQLKVLEKAETSEPDIQIRHSYPPIWQWPASDRTKVVYIQPWEYTKVPFEWQYKFETFADALIVPSNYVAKVFANGGLKPEKLFVVANGYNKELFNTNDDNSDSKYVNKDNFNFVYVGNSQWRKGLDILINAWKDAFKKFDKACLVIKDNPKIYGQSNILNEIIKMQYKTGCSDVVYIDEDLSDKEMAALFKASDVVVHPYRAEGFGMHVQEAMACGCVPIVSADGPTDDFVTNENGFILPIERRSVNITDSNVFAMKPGDAMTGMSTHTFYNEPNAESLKNGIKMIYHSHNKEEEVYSKKDAMNMINTWEKITKDYGNALEDIKVRNNIVRH
jgi:glycosyltransferase involved in cell wall biosynthesis